MKNKYIEWVKIIVWLWNPGKAYEKTRHNVGYMMVDILRESLWMDAWKESKFQSMISEWVYKGEKILLVKPMTFMNLSGDAVSSIIQFYKLDPKSDIIIMSDDIDMEFAKVRYRREGSHGGQNGLRDIIAKLGTHEFSRIKIGIGRNTHYSVSDWVLSKFTKEEIEMLKSEVFPIVLQYIHEKF